MQIYIPALSDAVCAFCTICISNKKYNPSDHNDAHKPMLFGKGREDEILLRHRQETSLRLGALGNAAPPQRARADRYLRLDHLVSGSLGILIWIQKADHPGPLIILQHNPIADRRRHGYKHHNRHCILPTKTRQENPDPQDRDERQGRTEIRLDHHHDHRQANQASQLEQIA